MLRAANRTAEPIDESPHALGPNFRRDLVGGEIDRPSCQSLGNFGILHLYAFLLGREGRGLENFAVDPARKKLKALEGDGDRRHHDCDAHDLKGGDGRGIEMHCGCRQNHFRNPGGRDGQKAGRER